MCVIISIKNYFMHEIFNLLSQHVNERQKEENNEFMRRLFGTSLLLELRNPQSCLCFNKRRRNIFGLTLSKIILLNFCHCSLWFVNLFTHETLIVKITQNKSFLKKIQHKKIARKKIQKNDIEAEFTHSNLFIFYSEHFCILYSFICRAFVFPFFSGRVI